MDNNVNYNQAPFGWPPFDSLPPFGDFQQPYAVDPGSIRFCLFKLTYVELINRESFFFFPVFVGPTSVAGWERTRRGWSFLGIDLREIKSFRC